MFSSFAARVAVKTVTLGLCAMGTLCLTPDVHGGEKQENVEYLNHKLASTLVHRFWRDVQHQDVAGYSSQLALRFQGLNIQGHYDRNEQIEGLENLTVTKFKIKNLHAARYDDTLVISYDFLAKGEGITSGPSIDVWFHRNSEWKQISHSYVPFLGGG